MKNPKRNRHDKNTDRERAWHVMRIVKFPFTVKDIARLSEAKAANLTHYFYALRKAGYIVVVDYRSMAPKPGQERLFRLVNNTGPRPPVQKDVGYLYDPNTIKYWVAN